LPVALLDANVLWSAPVRDTLLRAAEIGLYRPAWSQRILDEVARSLLEARSDLGQGRVDRLIAQLKVAFPESMTEGYEHLAATMTNDPEDRHVLAAAVAAHSDVLLTWNVQHFPKEACEPLGIAVQTPDEFLCELWLGDRDAMATVIRQQAADLANPAMELEGLLLVLGRLVPKFAALVRGRA
jgi:predicted nucleic acid-binding protein